jgi:serine/threonine protein kinase
MRLTDRYCITGELGRGAMGEVHRAFPFQDPSSEVAIKIIQRNRKLGPSDLLRFQKEAALMSQLHHQNIISFHELGIFEGEGDEGSNSGYYIVMEYARGYNLRDSLERDGRKDLPFFFQVGLQVAEALDYTHGKNIIHRDIKPHNIIVTQASKDERGVLVKVLDFGVARLAEAVNTHKDGEQNLAFDEQAGTPLYMAPEVIASSFGASDHRVDLYSLGCVLYEVLTGHPPFHGNTRDALERAHQHDEPQQLINLRPDVPVAVAAIIHKLLNKRPDDRYQTAFALQADLLRAKMLYEQNGRRMPSFSLGLKDRIYAVSAQLPLVGRKEELASLKDEYEKVNGLSGRSRMTVVSGPGGIGKTRLLSEFKTVLSKDKIKFVQGLFTQHENTLPFNALANAFNEILMRMLKIGGVDADNLSRKVKTIVGPDAHLIATVVPGLRVYLGDLSNVDVPSKVDETSFLRFAKAFSDFVRCLAPENQPLVFMFDDLHWADDKSLELVDQFFSNANSLKFHLVLSYQTDCRSLSPRFVEFLNKFRQLKRRFNEISLSPLATANVSALAKIALRHDDPIPDDFVHYIEKRSSGIPVRIVELLRRLVANDVIRLDGRNLQWEFDSKSLAQSRVQLHAIDIVLGRIKEFEGHDLAVLQAASVAGQTFHYEMLLLGDKHPGSRVLNVMERALEEGLIVRYSGNEDLNHLGKAYMFTHLKVRAAIYDAMSDSQKEDAHYDMAKCFMSLIKKPTGPQLFAITHHLNIYASLSSDNEEVDQIRLQYNVMSGDEAKKTSSPQAAEKYFDIALEICNKWPRISARVDLIAEIVERLADVNASQKKYGLALERYRELLSMPISIDKKTAIAARTVGFQMVGGLISDALKLMGGVLDKLGKEIPRGTLWAQTRTLFWIVWDVFDLRRNSRTVQGLRKVYDNHKRLGDRSDRRYPAAKIYHLAALLHGRNDIRTAMVAQDLGMTEVVNGRAPISSAIKIVADRAALIASLGSIRGSYRLFDMCANIAQKATYERALGYILLRRAESVDYIKGRHEDVSDNIRQAWSRLNPREDRLAFAQALTFKQYRELVRCNFSGVVSLGALMPDIVQTRNWHSQISVAITLYSFLLQGKRNKIVDEGTRFMRRREAVAARVDDLFSQVVLAMLTFSRGDTDPARHAFDRLVKLWVGQGNDGKRESLLPWQDDFISLFVCTYPVLFEQEYGRPLMRTSEMLALLKAMRLRGLFTIRQRRAVQLLLWARTNELLNKHHAVSKNYDVALRSSKEAGNLLVQTLCYMWFGVYLLDRGQTANRDYIRRAYSHARRNHMDGVAGWIRKAAEKRKVTITADVASNTGRAGVITAQIGEVMPTLAGQALSVVAADIDDQIPFEKSLGAVMGLLSHHHPGRAVLFLSNSPNKYGCIYPENPPGDVSRIYDGVSLYFNLRSTLTMHLYHANWLHEGASASVLYSSIGDTSPSMSSSVSDHSPPKAPYRGDLTEVVDVPSRQISETHEASSLSGNGSSNSVKPGREVSGMFALVPVRVQGETIGVILIEELGAIHAVDLNATRRDLDLFGIHIGSLVESKLSQDFGKANIALKHPLYKHEHGGFVFEDCSWLNFKLSGKMRTGREASWYVGLQWSADQYVVAYCCVRGEPTLRDQYSSEVFRQVLATRELARMSGRAKFEVSDLRSELGGLFTRNGTSSKMDELLFAFSIFDRTSPMVESGHFGGARPIVVSSENKVEAFNQVPVQLRDGRDVRYWEVLAQLDDHGLYILSFDTSKIRPQVDDLSTNRRTNEASTIPEGGKSTKRFIESAMSRNELPRYYLTVTRRVENLGLDEDSPSAEKKPA